MAGPPIPGYKRIAAADTAIKYLRRAAGE